MNETELGEIGIGYVTIRCPNLECNKLNLQLRLSSAFFGSSGWRENQVIKSWQLLPESSAKVLPDYVPPAIVEDYLEACRIRDLSAKASATLARRCLQGMIRDFWGVSMPKLKQEIDAIKDKVDADTWDAIESVRSVGNIGAHMEKDIGVIIDIEPEEAQLLIGLIETLVDDWYVARNARQERMKKVKALAAEKAARKE
jgi:hypothetical protein